MTRNHPVLIAPLCAALLATAFCVWTALGNDVNICVTTGCTLYQDFSVGGVSLWWLGTGAFAILAACALFGQAFIGQCVGAFFLFCDALLLVLMSLTAPCVSCLVVAALFAINYFIFRRVCHMSQRQSQVYSLPHSFLKIFWGAFFIINLGLVVRSQLNTWPIMDDGNPRVRVFFSLSCPRCIESLKFLSGRINIAYFPVADNDADIFKIAHMENLLNDGLSVAEAALKSRDIPSQGILANLDPKMLLLRFRLLRNKAYIFSAGSQGVPFFEYLGIPQEMLEKINMEKSPPSAIPSAGSGDASLPAEILDSGQCLGNQPCPPAN